MTRTEPAIRLVAPDDLDAWLPLWRGYQAFYRVEIAEATTRLTWQRLNDPAEPMWAALFWQDGRAVGLVQYLTHRSNWTQGDYCYLQDLFVAPETRGGGIGRALIAHAEAAARQMGCARLYWLTHETNVEAQQLYDRLAERSGFIQYRKIL